MSRSANSKKVGCDKLFGIGRKSEEAHKLEQTPPCVIWTIDEPSVWNGLQRSTCSNLGVHMLRGEAGSKNIARAKELVTRACEGKVQPACYHLKKL